MLVGGVAATFTQYNYLEQVVSEDEGIRDLEAWSKAYKAALEASDVGELFIDVPRDVPITKKAAPKPVNPLSLAVSSMDPDNGPSSAGSASAAAAAAPAAFEPLVIQVHYELRDPIGGVYFLLPDAEANPGRAPRMYRSLCPAHVSFSHKLDSLVHRTCVSRTSHLFASNLTVRTSQTCLCAIKSTGRGRGFPVWRLSRTDARGPWS